MAYRPKSQLDDWYIEKEDGSINDSFVEDYYIDNNDLIFIEDADDGYKKKKIKGARLKSDIVSADFIKWF